MPNSDIKCGLCELEKLSLDRGEVGVVLGEGSRHPKLLIVGEAPGKQEANVGKPFVGPAGKFLRDRLHRFGIDDFYITNVVKCRPPENRTPLEAEIKKCLKYLLLEVRLLQPERLLVLGNTAARALFEVKSVTQVRGQILKFDGVSASVTYHPAAVLREPKLISLFEADLECLFREKQAYSLSHIFCDNIQLIHEMSTELEASDAFSFDLETSTYNFWDGKVLCFGFSNGRKTWSVPLDHRDFDWGLEWNDVLYILKQIFNACNLKIAHNFKFDAKFLLNLGFKLEPPCFDTMLAHYILDPESTHALDALAPTVGLPKLDVIRFLNKKSDSFENVPIKELCEYCARDAEIAFRLFTKLSKKLSRSQIKLLSFLEQLSFVLMGIEREGIYVDKKRLDAVTRKYTEVADKLLTKLKGYGEINWDSTKQVSELFFKTLKFPVVSVTKKGSPSVDSTALEKLAKKYEVASVLMEYRKTKKLLATFLGESIHKFSKDNYIFPNFLIHGTATGRLAAREPNLLNIPRSGGIREIFSVPENYRFVEADYSQIELRVAAYLSNDKNLIELLESGVDIHNEIGKQIFGKPEISEHERFITKMVEFGVMYGRGPDSIAGQLKISTNQASGYIERFFTAFPALFQWREFVAEKAVMERKQVSIFGRVRYYQTNRVDEIKRQAYNFPIQSAAADITLHALVRLFYRLIPTKSRILMCLHDAIMFQVSSDELEEVTELIKVEMEKEVPEFRRSFPVEITVGDRWKSKE